jgi:hypothetical protein
MFMSSAIEDMGRSVGGWADVGTGVADALHDELDEMLANVTDDLTDAINRTLVVQDMIDSLLSTMGSESMATALLAVNHVSLLHAKGSSVGNPMEMVIEFVIKALTNLPTFQQALETFQAMLAAMKPALMQVGVWVETFADKVQATVEMFGTTMDRVQKLFDSVMSKVSPDAGEGADVMQHDTFNLFDTDGSGSISPEDLDSCGDIYALPAIKGDKGKELIEKYDANGDGEIQPELEFPLLTEDPSIVGITATILRAFAKRLSQVSGNVASSKMRGDVALSVVKYFQLVSARNITKVGWIADTLTNASLPLAFTADIMIQLALTKDDPNILTILDVGELVVGKMMLLNADYTSQAFDLLSTPEHFTSEGFEEDDQPEVVQTVSGWMQTGPAAAEDAEENRLKLLRREKAWHMADGASLAQLDAHDADLLEAMEMMPMIAKQMARERMRAHMLERRRARALTRLKRFDTEPKRLLLVKLLHGTAASDGGPLELAEKALAKGVPAAPETLEFARWLSWNASRDSDQFQKQCFNYTGESSSALDAFNTQVQGMVKKISMFIDLLKKYATPAAIEHMDDMAADFASHALEDVFEIVEVAIISALNGSSSEASTSDMNSSEPVDDISDADVSDEDTSGAIVDLPAEEEPSFAAVVSSLSPSFASLRPRRYDMRHAKRMWRRLAKQKAFLKQRHADKLLLLEANSSVNNSRSPSRERASPKVSAARRTKMRGKNAQHKKTKAATLAPRSVRIEYKASHERHWPKVLANTSTKGVMLSSTRISRRREHADGPSPVWEQVTTLLRDLEKVLPTCLDLLTYSRKEVSAVAAQLDSVFTTLRDSGVGIFFDIALYYRTIWMAYYSFVMPLTIALLMYGFWASGWFGGPQPLRGVDQKDYEPPRGFLDRLRCCCAACCRCCSDNHDKTSCFWSFILLFQVIVLLLFLVSVVFVIMAGIEIFTGTSCAQIYLLGDNKVCTETLNQLETFLSTFKVGDGEVPLSMACEHHTLRTCDLVKNKMLQAALMTVGGSFIAVLFHFELIFDVALIYERARWRRVINEMEFDDEKD